MKWEKFAKNYKEMCNSHGESCEGCKLNELQDFFSYYGSCERWCYYFPKDAEIVVKEWMVKQKKDKDAFEIHYGGKCYKGEAINKTEEKEEMTEKDKVNKEIKELKDYIDLYFGKPTPRKTIKETEEKEEKEEISRKDKIIKELEELFGYKYTAAGPGGYVTSHVFRKDEGDELFRDFKQVTIEDHTKDIDYDPKDYYIYVTADKDRQNFYGQRIIDPGVLTYGEMALFKEFIYETYTESLRTSNELKKEKVNQDGR